MSLMMPLSIWSEPETTAPASPLASPAGNLMERLAESAMSADSSPLQTEPAGEADLDPAYIQPDPVAEVAEVIAIPPAPLSEEQIAINEEMAYQRKLEDAEQEFMEASLRVHEIEGEIADKKAELKAARELSDAFALRLRSIRSGSADNDADDEDLDLDEDADETPVAAGAKPLGDRDADNAWRTAELRPIIEGTKGAGAKKLDAICDLCPTVGDFVDLQVQAGASGVNTLMPDGVGRKLCDVIEEKVLDFITSKQGGDFTKTHAEGSAALDARQEEVASGTEDQQDGAAGDDAIAGADENGEEIATAPAAPLALANDEQIKLRMAVIKKVWRSELVRKPECFDAGQQAANENQAFASCVLPPGDEQDSWLQGWCSVKFGD